MKLCRPEKKHTKIFSIGKLNPIKHDQVFTSDKDGHYDLDGVSYQDGQMYLSSNLNIDDKYINWERSLLARIHINKILVTYATREGQTEKIAYFISDCLKKNKIDVQVHNIYNDFEGDLSEFDFLLFGGSMHAGGLEKELVQFIEKHKEQIKPIPRAFFLVLLSAATKNTKLRAEWVSDAKKKATSQLAVPFLQFEMIAGALTYSKYSLPLKWIMKKLLKRLGKILISPKITSTLTGKRFGSLQ